MPEQIRQLILGYFAHEKKRPLGPYSRTMPRALWWSQGGGALSYERGTPVAVPCVRESPIPVRKRLALQV